MTSNIVVRVMGEKLDGSIFRFCSDVLTALLGYEDQSITIDRDNITFRQFAILHEKGGEVGMYRVYHNLAKRLRDMRADCTCKDEKISSVLGVCAHVLLVHLALHHEELNAVRRALLVTGLLDSIFHRVTVAGGNLSMDGIFAMGEEALRALIGKEGEWTVQQGAIRKDRFIVHVRKHDTDERYVVQYSPTPSLLRAVMTCSCGSKEYVVGCKHALLVHAAQSERAGKAVKSLLQLYGLEV